jgi:hypothetical protein
VSIQSSLCATNKQHAARLAVVAALLIAAGLELSAQQPAQPPAADERPRPTVSIDPDRSIDTGADFTLAMLVLASDLEEAAFSRLERSARTNIPLGIAKAVLLDHPMAVFMLVMQHEAFGHGGRAREFGATATFRVGSPWTSDTLFNGGTRFGGGASWGGNQTTSEERGRIYAGGTEANTRAGGRHALQDRGVALLPAQPLVSQSIRVANAASGHRSGGIFR